MMKPHRENCTTGATRFGWLFAERMRTLRAVHWLEPLD